MRQFFLIMALSAMSLTACSPTTSLIGASPVAMADTTKLDEQLMLGAESLYASANQLAFIAVDVGRLTPEQQIKLKGFDNAAYNALLAARSAYKAGNSSDYFKAIGALTNAANQISTIAGSR